jgi:hypothetical protein
MKFTKRHYIAIAEVLRWAYMLKYSDKPTVNNIISDFISLFREDNPKFNRKTFVKAITC